MAKLNWDREHRREHAARYGTQVFGGLDEEPAHRARSRKKKRRKRRHSAFAFPTQRMAAIDDMFSKYKHLPPIDRAVERASLAGLHLTQSSRAVSIDAHHPGSSPVQLEVVWSPSMPTDSEGPSLTLVQQGCFQLGHYSLPSAPSWRTIAAYPTYFQIGQTEVIFR
jgi:hypothetical protein